MRIKILWDVTLCSVVDSYQRLRGNFCLHIQCITVNRTGKSDMPFPSLLILAFWREKQRAPPKILYISNNLRGITSRFTVIYTINVHLRISFPIIFPCPFSLWEIFSFLYSVYLNYIFLCWFARIITQFLISVYSLLKLSENEQKDFRDCVFFFRFPVWKLIQPTK
jgi:hypothetical protein